MRELLGRGALRVLAASVLWGTLGPTFKGLLAAGAEPLHIAFWRTLIGGVALVLWALWRGQSLHVQRHNLPLLLVYGLVSVAVFFTIYPTAVSLSSVTVAAVLLYTAPAWVALLAALVFREPLTARKLLSIAITFVGIALIAGAYNPSAFRANGWGILAGLGSGITYALFSIFGKAALRHTSPVTTMIYTLAFGGLFLLPFALRDGAPLVAPLRSPAGIALLLYIGLVPTAASMLLYTSGLQRLGDAGRASILATVEPLVAALLGYLLLGEALSPPQWLGGALILSGVGALAWPAATGGPTR